jgi:hypothetical protein
MYLLYYPVNSLRPRDRTEHGHAELWMTVGRSALGLPTVDMSPVYFETVSASTPGAKSGYLAGAQRVIVVHERGLGLEALAPAAIACRRDAAIAVLQNTANSGKEQSIRPGAPSVEASSTTSTSSSEQP